jgi:hypothetical protein
MRKRTLLLLGAILVLLLAACSRELTDKSRIIALFRKNESTFLSAAETGDFSAVSRLRGIREITPRGDEGEIEFYCGGRWLVPASSYYGILFIPGAEDAELSQVFGASPEWSAEGEGYRYRQTDGDNDFYYEPLGYGFFYYEEHF